ncbi:L,D-transpeptidase [Pelosinus fermentans]|uniref:ErfK/YbiS/YcfS/YnhG family protein n=1 Tax=Pelosinus fermentans JBW45 TaxID=1192197 RepID=I8TY31_9FIRM|nr:L,D-transpeptidase [Pelosinus fermentans]AJQ30017.1 ErfK/YbiS/YcfS/YnhG family protein [Pelosinus fermentans JBW45]
MKKHIAVNLTTFRTSYYEDDTLIKEYSVGIGKADTPTPPGNYQIIEKLIFEKIADVDLGSRRLVLSSDKTCLHGSWNGPVEGYVSGGCVRMYNQDIEELFENVEIGTPVIMIP